MHVLFFFANADTCIIILIKEKKKKDNINFEIRTRKFESGKTLLTFKFSRFKEESPTKLLLLFKIFLQISLRSFSFVNLKPVKITEIYFNSGLERRILRDYMFDVSNNPLTDYQKVRASGHYY